MGYYQGSNNFYTKYDQPRYEMLPYPINYNQSGHDGTNGFGNAAEMLSKNYNVNLNLE